MDLDLAEETHSAPTFFPAIAALPTVLLALLLHHGSHDEPTPIQIIASLGSWLLKGTGVLMLWLMGVFLLFGLLSHFASWLVSSYSTSGR